MKFKRKEIQQSTSKSARFQSEYRHRRFVFEFSIVFMFVPTAQSPTYCVLFLLSG